MIRVALKGLLGRKLRTSLTAIAIVLGVAMVAGTFMLTDSIDKAFGSIFTDVRKGSNAVISGKTAFDISSDVGASAPTLPDSLLGEVRGLPDVEAAEGSVDGQAQLIGKNGKAIVYGGAPNLGFSIAAGASRFNPLTLVEGDCPNERGGGSTSRPRARSTSRSGRRSESRPRDRRKPCASRASSASAPSRRSAAPRSPASTYRRPRTCSTSAAGWTRSPSPRGPESRTTSS
jgi:hypothetical protein